MKGHLKVWELIVNATEFEGTLHNRFVCDTFADESYVVKAWLTLTFEEKFMVFNGITPFKKRLWFWIYSAILCNESVTVHFFEAGGSIGGLDSILSEFHSLGIN